MSLYNGPVGQTARVQFGSFDYTPSTGELLLDGRRVRLPSQPSQVLTMLVENAGELVTRESLRQAIWGDGTFVDFDRGLNFCIGQIRSALRDSADSPRYIRTLPKRGYMFIAPVKRIPATDSEPPSENCPPPGGTIPAAPSRKIVLVWTTVILMAVAALVAGIRFLGSRHDTAPPPIRIAVVRFDNQTGSPDLDRFADGLTDSVVGELTASGGGRYGVIGNAAILRQPRANRDLMAIGSTLQASYVILGQVQGGPAHIRILGQLIRLPEQTHLKVIRPECDPEDPHCTQPELARQIVSAFVNWLTPVKPAGAGLTETGK